MELKRKSSKIIREWYHTSKLINTPVAISVLKQAGSIDELIMGLSTISEQIITTGKTVVFIATRIPNDRFTSAKRESII